MRTYKWIGPDGGWRIGRCAEIDGSFPADQIERDHIEPCGSLRSFEELGEFARRLLVEVDGLQKLCAECHQKRKGEA